MPASQSGSTFSKNTRKSRGPGGKPKGVTFTLAERSTRDPLAYDANASQTVLIPQVGKHETPQEKREKELSYRKYLGIDFEDDHDYEKYLKSGVDGQDLNEEEMLAQEMSAYGFGSSQPIGAADPLDGQKGFMTKDEIYGNYIGTAIDAEEVDPDVLKMLEEVEDLPRYKPSKEEKFRPKDAPSDEEESDDEEDTLQEEIIEGEDFDDDFVAQMMEGGDDEGQNGDLAGSDEDLPQSTSKMSYIMQQFLGSDTDAKMMQSILKNGDLMNIPEDAELEFEEVSDVEDNMPDFDDKKSRFTQYSMTSSVMRRRAGLQRLDEDFEQFYAEFDDDKIGDLENQADEIGLVNEELTEMDMNKMMMLHMKQVDDGMPLTLADLELPDRQTEEEMLANGELPPNYYYKQDPVEDEEDPYHQKIKDVKDPGLKAQIKAASLAVHEMQNEEEAEDQEKGVTYSDKIDEVMALHAKKKPEYDCESILSTRSNLYGVGGVDFAENPAAF